MKINFMLDRSKTEIEVLISASTMSEDVNAIIEKLSDEKPKILVGFRDGKAKIFNEEEIISIYSANKKVYVKTAEYEYLLKVPLYEALARVSKSEFVRISNTEIVNIKKVKEFDLSIAGTICIRLSNGQNSYVSRRYVAKIKSTLGIGGM